MGMIAEAFRTGGVWMYFIFALGIFATPCAVLTMILTVLATEKRRKALIGAGVLNLVLVFVVVGVGFTAYSLGMMEVEQALSKVSPEHIEKMKAAGTQMAEIPLQFSLIVGTLPLMAGVSALVRQSGLS